MRPFSLLFIPCSNGIEGQRPPTTATNALEIYVLGCLISVIMVLFQYVFIIYKDSPIASLREGNRKRIEKRKQRLHMLRKRRLLDKDNPLEMEAKLEWQIDRLEQSLSIEGSDEMDRSLQDHSLSLIVHEMADEEVGSGVHDKPVGCCKQFLQCQDTNYIDIYSIALFPMVFVTFNIIYWTYFYNFYK